jgi:hypothetical protein
VRAGLIKVKKNMAMMAKRGAGAEIDWLSVFRVRSHLAFALKGIRQFSDAIIIFVIGNNSGA